MKEIYKKQKYKYQKIHELFIVYSDEIYTDILS